MGTWLALKPPTFCTQVSPSCVITGRWKCCLWIDNLLKKQRRVVVFFFPWPVSVREVSEVRVTASYYHDKDIPYSLKRCKLLALTHSFSRTHTSVLEKESYSHIDACRCRICIWIQTLVWNTQRSLEIFAHSFQSETGQWEQSHTLANLCQFSLWPMALAGQCHI